MCICQECGAEYSVDFMVSDYVWGLIKPKDKPEGAGLLCGKCIAHKIEEMSGYACYHIVLK